MDIDTDTDTLFFWGVGATEVINYIQDSWDG